MFGTTLYRLASVGSAIALTVGAAPAVQAQTGAAIELALPAQPLASALREIAVRSRTDVIAASDVVAGKQAPALQGRYTAEEAVRLLISRQRVASAPGRNVACGRGEPKRSGGLYR